MRLTDFCNHLTSRAPARCPIPDRAGLAVPSLALRGGETFTDPPVSPDEACASSTRHRTSHRVELRLTADLQLRLCHNLRTGMLGPKSPHRRRIGPPRSMWTPDRGILRDAPPDRGLVDRHRACSSASDALCRDRRVRARPCGLARARNHQGPPRPPPSSKGSDVTGTRAPSIDECPLPCRGATWSAARAAYPARRGTSELATLLVTSSPTCAFAQVPCLPPRFRGAEGRDRRLFESPPPCARPRRRAPASNASFTAPPYLGVSRGRWARLDSCPSRGRGRRARRFPSTSAISTACEHDLEIVPIPGRRSEETGSAYAELEGTSGWGLAPSA